MIYIYIFMYIHPHQRESPSTVTMEVKDCHQPLSLFEFRFAVLADYKSALELNPCYVLFVFVSAAFGI